MNNFKIYIAHHRPLKNRIIKLKNDLAKQGLDFEIIDQYLPENIKDKYYEYIGFDNSTLIRDLPPVNFNQYKIYENAGRILNIPELSLFLKHKLCLQKQIDYSFEKILILEDDVLIPTNFKQYLDQCLMEFSNFNPPLDIAVLGTAYNIKSQNKKKGCFLHYENFQITRATHAIIYSLDCATKIIDHLEKKNWPIDLKLNEIIIKENLKVAWSEPGLLQSTQTNLENSSIQEHTISNFNNEGDYKTKYMNTNGLAYSCNKFPIFLKFNSSYFDENDYMNIKNNDVVFVQTNSLISWFRLIYPRLLKNKISVYLVTGNSDKLSPLSLFKVENKEIFIDKIFKEGVIKHWFTQNCDFFNHKKISYIPLGVNYHDIHRKPYKYELQTHFLDQDSFLDAISYNRSQKNWSNKKNLILIDQNLIKKSDFFSNKSLFFVMDSKLPKFKLLKHISEFKFIVIDLDKYRDSDLLWECLILGVVPIILKSSFNPFLKRFPILWVDSYSLLNENFINSFNFPINFKEYEKYFLLDYWVAKIRDISKKNDK